MALGADARRVLAGIFGRACAQLGAGVALGLIAAAALDTVSGGGIMAGNELVLLPTVMAVMFAVGRSQRSATGIQCRFALARELQ